MAGACEARSYPSLFPYHPKGVSMFSVVNDSSHVCVYVPHSATRRGRRGYIAFGVLFRVVRAAPW